MYQQPYQPVHKPMSDYLKPLLSDLVLAALLFVGLFLVWLGSLIAGVADRSGGIETGLALKSFGVLMATWGLVIGGMLRHDMERWVRVAMIVAGSAIILFVGYWSASIWWGF
ncbi:MAG: hypothetical protein A3K60_06765 [Euryarchaeota archaeon RBG_19FT_COMBO_56_21]|nr:MAG: hypothetical protein A3K60_06765 [Euryarchaeota archaeon RBG_19FT_COMBO_56_21]